MTGHEGPSDAEMMKRLEKRLDHISKYDKRYNRKGTGVGKDPASKSQSKQASNPGVASDQKADPKNGYPQVDLDASNSSSLTKAKTPTAANSLGLNIMCAYLTSSRIDGPLSWYPLTERTMWATSPMFKSAPLHVIFPSSWTAVPLTFGSVGRDVNPNLVAIACVWFHPGAPDCDLT